ncbi:hypothetical protein TNCV_3911661, partial [Trichonephila clavipes]
PRGRVVAYRTFASQVRVLFPGWARSTQPFIPAAVSRRMSTKLAWGLKNWGPRFRLTT